MYIFPRQIRRAYESIPVPIAYYQYLDQKVVTVLVSDGLCSLMGMNRETLTRMLDNSMFERVHPDDAGRLAHVGMEYAQHRCDYDLVFRSKLASDEEYHYIHTVAKRQTMDDGTQLSMVVYSDVTENLKDIRRLEDSYRLFQQDTFYTDPVTKLPNGNYLHEFADEKLNRLLLEGQQPALVYLDVTSMKSYNRQYGFAKGDELLRLVGKVLTELFPNGLIVRAIDDQFVLMIPCCDPQRLSQRLDEANERIRREAYGVITGIQAGVCLIDEGIQTAQAMDRAKYALLHIGHDLNVTHRYYTDEDKEAYWRQRYILEQFDAALENHWIHVYYHAIMRSNTGKACALEALARWVDPEQGIISPADFIPVLEKYHQLYRLDLYMAEQVCREIPLRLQAGFPLIPVSINFSAQDFDHVDLTARLNEITQRHNIEQYGLTRRDFIVEITEQDIAAATDRFKEQLSALRRNGYQIWVDDFGSGYSSLNVFSQYDFDLIKFDLELLRHLDDHNSANRHIMKAMVNAAHTMGIHTLAEGVENRNQLEFLRRIDCELAQGFFFSQPTPLEKSLFEVRSGRSLFPCETREESVRQNTIASTDAVEVSPRKNTAPRETIGSLFENLPGLCFSKDAKTGVYLACNQNFAEYAHKENPSGVIGLTDAEIFDAETAAHFVEDDHKALAMDEPYVFFEDVPDAAGNLRHFQTTKLKYVNDAGKLCALGLCQDVTDLVRLLKENAVTREAYEKERSNGIIYSHIARTLIHGYMDLYYVNLDTEEFIEYHTDDDLSTLSEARRGGGFFRTCRQEISQFIHPEDQAALAYAMELQNLERALDRNNTFMMTYRVMREGTPIYVSMKISRMKDDERIIVLGITNVDEQVKREKAQERMAEERNAYERINALTGDFLCIYIVVPETGRYREYSSTAGYQESFSLPKEGEDFFTTTREKSMSIVHPEDLDRFLSVFTRQNIYESIRQHGFFSLSYRIFFAGKPIYVQLKAAMVKEKTGRRLIVGINDIDAQVRQEAEYKHRLAMAQKEASLDALTGVKNKHAYQDAEEELNRQIQEHAQPAFSIVILDVNDLKEVNDTAGHKAGDHYLIEACRIISTVFRQSSIFRVGGDEFAVISQGEDYLRIEELMGMIEQQNRQALCEGGMVIACGMSKYEGDSCVGTVFERADHNMYQNKKELKREKRKKT